MAKAVVDAVVKFLTDLSEEDFKKIVAAKKGDDDAAFKKLKEEEKKMFTEAFGAAGDNPTKESIKAKLPEPAAATPGESDADKAKKAQEEKDKEAKKKADEAKKTKDAVVKFLTDLSEEDFKKIVAAKKGDDDAAFKKLKEEEKKMFTEAFGAAGDNPTKESIKAKLPEPAAVQPAESEADKKAKEKAQAEKDAAQAETKRLEKEKAEKKLKEEGGGDQTKKSQEVAPAEGDKKKDLNDEALKKALASVGVVKDVKDAADDGAAETAMEAHIKTLDVYKTASEASQRALVAGGKSFAGKQRISKAAPTDDELTAAVTAGKAAAEESSCGPMVYVGIGVPVALILAGLVWWFMCRGDDKGEDDDSEFDKSDSGE